MTVEQKRKIEREMNWFSNDGGRYEIVGILFTLNVLGYRVDYTEKGYEIRNK